MAKARVAVLKTKPETVLEDVGRTMELGEVKKHLAAGSTTILKDNISWHFPFPGANTTPWQLEGTIQKLRADGYTDQVCVQNNTVVTDPKKGERLNRYLPVLDKYDIPVRYNCFADDLKWITYKPKGKMLVLPKIYPEGITIPEFFLGKNIVHLPTVKCHIYTTTTGAMKNAFGGLLHLPRHYTPSWIHETLVDLLAIQKEIHTGVFAIMDGTTAGNGPGPRTMYPVVKNVMLASADQVAIDAVSAKMMGFDPLSLDYIRLAHEDRLGVGDPREIEIVGDVDAAQENWKFHVGKNLVRVGGGDLIWFGPLKKFQKLFFHTPLVNGFILASDVYHDFYRWPLVDRRVFERWCETTAWGQMFLRYAQTGPQGRLPLADPAGTTPTSARVH